MNKHISVNQLNRVGPAMVGKLKRLGINTTQDLLQWYPFRYEDFRQIMPIKSLSDGLVATVQGRVELIRNKRSFRKRKMITEALISDDSGSIRVIWFNQPFIIKNLQPGDMVNFSGKVKSDMLGLQFVNPIYELANTTKTAHTARLVPIYPLTHGITQKQMRALIKQVLALNIKMTDWLSIEYINTYNLIDLDTAIKNIHFPESVEDLALAEERLKFEELFVPQLQSELIKLKNFQLKSPKISFQENEIKKFVAELPFQLTASQKISAWEILKDLTQDNPMNRLLSGDVGSGKTVVAALALLNVALNGYQGVIMAPTEILARQHFDTLYKLLGEKFSLALLTGSDYLVFGQNIKIELDWSKNKKQKYLLELIANGQIQIIVGTHALLSDKLMFNDVGLVVVDEQHRFGVEQRKKIKDKTKKVEAHYLSMTATPIPRSLALMIYGDLNVSVINELPANRKPVITRLVEPHNRHKAYGFIREQVNKGGQIFVVCPLIDNENHKQEMTESMEEDVVFSKVQYSPLNEQKTVMGEYDKLSKQIFPDMKIGYLHGKMKSVEKNEIMNKFKNKQLDILISTSVIEVGVDIPEATVMMIEGAERFGLAQLHQFRGRVGRNDKQSYCLVFTDSNSEKSISRLKYFESIKDGFSLAEKDLATRGPGEVYGVTQSGLMNFRLAKLSDITIINKARSLAKKIAPNLDQTPLAKKLLVDWLAQVHLE